MDRDGRVLQAVRHDPSNARLARERRRARDARGSGRPSVGRDRRRAGPAGSHRPGSSATTGTTRAMPDSLRDSFIMSLYEEPDRSGVDRHARRRRQPLESAQLGARRPSAGVAAATSWSPPSPMRPTTRSGSARWAAASTCSTLRPARPSTSTPWSAAPTPSVICASCPCARIASGTLWIGTMESGLQTARRGRTARVHSACKAGDPHSLSAAGIMTHLRGAQRTDLDRHPWRRRECARSGERADPSAALWRRAPARSAAPTSRRSPRMRSGNLWIGTDGGGLDLARPDGSVIKVFRHDPRRSRHAAGQHRVCAGGRCPRIASGWEPTAAAWRRCSAPPLPRRRSASSVVTREEGLSSDTIYGVRGGCRGADLAERQCRADALRSGDRQPSRPITASTACRARSSTSAPTPAAATGGCASAVPAASTSSIRRA